ncbi:rod-determining factor RdfA [Natrialba sp. PRR66]|uniref:rod-determining factor RdfA n=1 Tax=Natrialba sp. PRR66 TaxID=3098146 RepID=UPI002B1D7F13|nr:rod-determining factor RdfA [Natrialba sp. PRR66]
MVCTLSSLPVAFQYAESFTGHAETLDRESNAEHRNGFPRERELFGRLSMDDQDDSPDRSAHENAGQDPQTTPSGSTESDTSTPAAPASRSKPGPQPKVARLISEYDRELAGVGDELEARWTNPETDASLRSLADWFNEQLLRAVLTAAGIETITEDVSHLYAVLSGETGSRGERTQLERRLERDGVAVETVTDEFVSYGAIRSYLTGCRNATAPSSTDGPSAAATARTIEELRQRTVSVTESKLDRLQETEQLRVGPRRVFADVQVLCERCGKQYDVADLLESGACDCYEP